MHYASKQDHDNCSSHHSNLFSFFFFFFSVRLHCSSAQTLVTPVSKDKSTSLYTLSIYLKTPLQLSKLHLDLGSYIPWHDCDRGRYNDSSSYRPVHAKTALCKEMVPRAISYCYEPAHPGCANNSCGFFLRIRSPGNPPPAILSRTNLHCYYRDPANAVSPDPFRSYCFLASIQLYSPSFCVVLLEDPSGWRLWVGTITRSQLN
ncbi:UNVERIFIED_CONTAM: putative aspartic proteinase GIP1 [Sesamum calycinum]|uniref:Aspartic proteinase GIP1 n=1 Tax=Sesamum calycinum TaxID=2727403 RepID=A0AAW2SHC5_9LAMI